MACPDTFLALARTAHICALHRDGGGGGGGALLAWAQGAMRCDCLAAQPDHSTTSSERHRVQLHATGSFDQLPAQLSLVTASCTDSLCVHRVTQHSQALPYRLPWLVATTVTRTCHAAPAALHACPTQSRAPGPAPQSCRTAPQCSAGAPQRLQCGLLPETRAS